MTSVISQKTTTFAGYYTSVGLSTKPNRIGEAINFDLDSRLCYQPQGNVNSKTSVTLENNNRQSMKISSLSGSKRSSLLSGVGLRDGLDMTMRKRRGNRNLAVHFVAVHSY